MLLFLPWEAVVLSQDTGEIIALNMWQELQKVPIPATFDNTFEFDLIELINNPEGYYEKIAIAFWENCYNQCTAIFLKHYQNAVRADELPQFAKVYASKFGVENADSDIRWALACPALTSQSYYLLEPSFIDLEFTAEFKIFSKHFNKAIVNHCITSEDYYRRIHWFTLWAGNHPFSKENKDIYYENVLSSLNDCFQKISTKKWKEEDHEYWFSVRFFLSIIYLCDYEKTLAFNPKNMEREEFLKISDDFKKYSLLMFVPKPVFDHERAKYTVPMTFPQSMFRCPPLDLPQSPFPEVSLLKDNARQKHFLPLISRELFRNDLDINFLQRINGCTCPPDVRGSENDRAGNQNKPK